jgi:hypothetical protein
MHRGYPTGALRWHDDRAWSEERAFQAGKARPSGQAVLDRSSSWIFGARRERLCADARLLATDMTEPQRLPRVEQPTTRSDSDIKHVVTWPDMPAAGRRAR